MTDETNTHDENTGQEPEQDQEPAPIEGANDPVLAKARREAANYRRKLRAAETENATLSQRLTATQRAEAERAVADRLDDPGDLWVAGVELDELVGEDGALDPAKLDEATRRVLQQHPAWRKQDQPNFDGGAREPTAKPGPDFGEALKRAAS